MSPFTSGFFFGGIFVHLITSILMKISTQMPISKQFHNNQRMKPTEKKIADKIYFYVFYVYVLCSVFYAGAVYNINTTEQNEQEANKTKHKKKARSEMLWKMFKILLLILHKRLLYTLEKLVPN